jgi:NADH dehydrogenase [ubiquinone] 1 alpha subcomplex assembly factor 7
VAREARDVSGATSDEFAARLIARIRAAGPISITEYMRECNAHYYATRDPFGAAGDFTTAPEISQVFGELIGAWLADYWQRMGAPNPVLLVELGPGRGTLMADALRATRRVPGFHDALKLHLVEQSPVLRRIQQEKLAAYAPQFHDTMTRLPPVPGPMLVIANEFFDALPIAQFEYRAGRTYERKVALGSDGTSLVIRREPTRDEAVRGALDGDIREASVTGYVMAHALARRIARSSGAMLIIDYGYFPTGFGDTLQALRRHRPVSIFDSPGEADLTAHVDFESLAKAANSGGGTVHGPVSQASFLLELGIAAREAALIKKANPEQQVAIRSGCRRLIEPAEMGSLFKVLALTQKGGPVPAGFGVIT